MDARATQCEEGSILSVEDRESLISLLNKPLMDEVIEERLIRGLCCNLTTCQRPQMDEGEV